MRDYIIHIDGDAYFASCEVARRPDLRGLPVVVGEEKGIACAMTYEAKKLGVYRGMPVFKIRQEFPQVVVISSHFELYHEYNNKLVQILKQYLPKVERYSVDECFAITPKMDEKDIVPFVEMLKSKVQTSLGITFSFGVATTKTLAKIASKKDKPDGLVVLLDPNFIEKTLTETPVASVWGIGRQTSAKLVGMNVLTVKQFIDVSKYKILSLFSEPVFHTQEELKGNKIFEVNTTYDPQKSVQATRSMEKSTSSEAVLWSELSRNVEMACEDIRGMNLLAGSVGFFYKKAVTRYRVSHAFKLSFHTDDPVMILKEIKIFISKVYQKNEHYKGTGVSLYDLRSKDMVTDDLFGITKAMDVSSNLRLKAIDGLNRKFGKWTIMHASSLNSVLRRNKEGEERDKKDNFIYGLPLPYMGEVN